MNNIQTLGKFLDQPILVAKFQKTVPAILTAGATAYTIHSVRKEEKSNKLNKGLKTGITLGVTVASALAAAHISSAITKRPLPPSLNTLKKNNKDLIDNFIKTTNIEENTKNILNKGKEKILNFKDVKSIFTKLGNDKNGKEFLEKLIPSPQNIKAKDIFSEIGYLSIYGAIPVVGGITGGIIADKVTEKNWKDKIPDKIKEGSYQYLANIFMCNVGAGAALGILEKFGITSKTARAIGMTAGIIATGIIGGSKIANFIGKKVIDPIFSKNKKNNDYSDILEMKFNNEENLLRINKNNKKERTPEVLDIGLHTDDIATVSLLSGLKWIEPALPIMYTISGFRSGIGYRN